MYNKNKRRIPYCTRLYMCSNTGADRDLVMLRQLEFLLASIDSKWRTLPLLTNIPRLPVEGYWFATSRDTLTSFPNSLHTRPFSLNEENDRRSGTPFSLEKKGLSNELPCDLSDGIFKGRSSARDRNSEYEALPDDSRSRDPNSCYNSILTTAD